MAHADWNNGSPAGSNGIVYDAAAASYHVASNGTYPETNGVLKGAKQQLAGYYPEQYIPELKENLRDNTILTRITNTDFQGKFKNKGDTIVIRHTPKVHNQAYVEGVPLQYEDPEAGRETHVIKRARYYAFKVRDVRQILSDVKGFANTWTKEGAVELAENREIEFFASIPTEIAAADINSSSGGAIPQNIGTQAGKRSQGYNLGTAAAPVALFNTDAAASASGVSGARNIVDFIVDCEGVLAEQPGGLKGRPFIILPTILFTKLKTSELKDASLSGDSVSMLRQDIEAVGRISGFDVFRSNLIAKNAAGAYPIIFGDTSAITFADEISETEMVRDQTDFASLHRSLCVYDWFLRWPERVGLAYGMVGTASSNAASGSDAGTGTGGGEGGTGTGTGG